MRQLPRLILPNPTSTSTPVDAQHGRVPQVGGLQKVAAPRPHDVRQSLPRAALPAVLALPLRMHLLEAAVRLVLRDKGVLRELRPV